jgi:hypothetical protein
MCFSTFSHEEVYGLLDRYADDISIRKKYGQTHPFLERKVPAQTAPGAADQQANPQGGSEGDVLLRS